MNKRQDKIDLYELTMAQISEVLSAEDDFIANMSNFIAVIHHNFNFFWTGFYLVKQKELVLSVFQGPIACTRIAFNKGVCGSSWAKKETLIVDDVHQFPGHIACSAQSNSEIVIPLLNDKNEVLAVLDIDSTEFATFDEVDQQYLEKIIHLLLVKYPSL